LLGLGSAVAAQAQLGLYGMYSATGMSGITCLDPQGKCSSGGGKVNPSGGSGGLYYDFRKVGPVMLGVDVRAGQAHANKSAVNSSGGDDATVSDYFLGGLRGSVKTKITWLRPYAQVSAGLARTDASEPYAVVNGQVTKPFDNFLQYEVFAGADIRILPILDLRVVELGIGNMSRVGTGSGSSSIGVKSIGGGVVLHFP
jgi:hypothetical protein